MASSGETLAFTATVATTSGGNWLALGAGSGTTPATLAVSVNPAGLATGTYTGTVTIASSGASNSPVSVPVNLSVTATSQLTVAPGSLSFHFQTGAATPANQTLSVTSSGSPLSFTVSASTSSGGSWLLLGQSSGTTPASISVGVNPVGLASGTYNGSVTITGSGAAGGPVTIPVSLTVSANPSLNVSPAALSFYFQIGGTPPSHQTLSLSNSGAPVNFAVSTSTTSGGAWLVAAPLAGATPGNVNISVNAAGLSAGQYAGSVTITAAGVSNSPVTVPVSLTVTANPLLSVSSSSLSFDFQIGGAPPANQTLTLASTGAALGYTVSTSTSSGGSWLAVGPLAGTTSGSVVVAVNPAGLLPGTYAGSVTFAAPGAGNSPQTVPVTLTVSQNPLLILSTSSLSFGFQTGTAVPVNQTVSVSSTGAPLGFSVSAATSSGGNWLAVSTSSGTTPGVLTVGVNPAGLAVGTYTGTITVTAAGAANSPRTISVTLFVSNTALIIASPGSLNFTGSSGISIQTASLTSTDGTPLTFAISTTTSAGGDWLLVGPLIGTTPSNLNVTVNPSGLAAGTYTGSIVVTAPSAPNSPQTISVTLTIAPSAVLAVSPTSISFSQAPGAAPVQQSLMISSSGGSVAFSASAATSSGGNWLSVTPSGGTTPASLIVTANGGALAPGTYTGSITIVSTGAANSPQIISVTLTVGAALAVSPTSLSFSFPMGSLPPAAQAVSVAAGGASLNFTVSTAVETGAWLSTSLASGSTPANFNVFVNPAGLGPGTYNGTITIGASGATNTPQTIRVSLVVTAAPLVPSVGAVVNAASFLPAAVSPGQIITIFGSGIGPAVAASLRLTAAGVVDTTLGDTRVLFDGIAGAMVYASSRQTSVIVPYEIAGRATTQIELEYQGVRSIPVSLRVADTAPGIFTLDASGAGPGAVLNQNLSVNSAANPAPRGSIVVIYATGEGQTTPAGINGLITGSVLRRPVQSVTVTIGGQAAEVLYAGAAPTLVSGVLQVNAQVPAGIAAGAAVPVVVTVGGASSQPGVTIAVQ